MCSEAKDFQIFAFMHILFIFCKIYGISMHALLDMWISPLWFSAIRMLMVGCKDGGEQTNEKPIIIQASIY